MSYLFVSESRTEDKEGETGEALVLLLLLLNHTSESGSGCSQWKHKQALGPVPTRHLADAALLSC